jgi:hypothetical protein
LFWLPLFRNVCNKPVLPFFYPTNSLVQPGTLKIYAEERKFVCQSGPGRQRRTEQEAGLTGKELRELKLNWRSITPHFDYYYDNIFGMPEFMKENSALATPIPSVSQLVRRRRLQTGSSAAGKNSERKQNTFVGRRCQGSLIVNLSQSIIIYQRVRCIFFF